MFVFLSKFLPIFFYPLGLACILLGITLVVKKQSRWLKICVGIALGLLWFGGTKPVSMVLVRSLEWQYLPPEDSPEAEMIVVLGGGTDSAEYPRNQVELGADADRIFYTSRLFHQEAAPKILLTGGYISWMGERKGSPAENMAVVLGMLGVPNDALLLETESQNTYENAYFSKKILDRKRVTRIILVTSAQHMPRALASFEELGIEVIPAPTDYTVTQADWDRLWEPDLLIQFFNLFPSVGNLSATTNVMKEYMGMIVYKWRGWIQ